MKATMNQYGLITLTAETPQEAWTLSQWSLLAYVHKDDETRMESGHWRGSMLMVDCGKPEGGT